MKKLKIGIIAVVMMLVVASGMLQPAKADFDYCQEVKAAASEYQGEIYAQCRYNGGSPAVCEARALDAFYLFVEGCGCRVIN